MSNKLSNPIYLYFYYPLQVINFNYLNMQVGQIISSHVMSSFSIKKYFWKFKEQDASPYTMSSLST
jgi:hypothetical protein